MCALQWRHNERDSLSNHRRLDCLFNRLFRCKSKKTSKFRVTGLCEGNSPVTGEFPTQRASNAEYVSIRWCHHGVPSPAPNSQSVYKCVPRSENPGFSSPVATPLILAPFSSSTSAESSFFAWQHLQQPHAAVMTRSSGSQECNHSGKKSHVRSLAGRQPGFLDCSMFTMATKMPIIRKGAPTATSTYQPARERPNTMAGKTKNIMMR